MISRRRSENHSPRPFWRICWDWVDFPRGYDGTNWLLVIKDEYSGKLFGFPSPDKSGASTLAIITNFESWVRRQFRLSICKIRQDGDTGAISQGFNPKSFQLWAERDGIGLEISPPETHEPNGGVERARVIAMIERGIAMQLQANLPGELWPEITKAAIWLYNMCPSHAHNLRSPNEVLYDWFRQYFRWHTPELIKELTIDLK